MPIVKNVISIKKQTEREGQTLLGDVLDSYGLLLEKDEFMFLLLMEKNLEMGIQKNEPYIVINCQTSVDYEIACSIAEKIQPLFPDPEVEKFQTHSSLNHQNVAAFNREQVKFLLKLIEKLKKVDSKSGVYTTAPQKYIETDKISFTAKATASDDDHTRALTLLAPLSNALAETSFIDANASWKIENSVKPDLLLASITVKNIVVAEKLVELTEKTRAEISIEIKPIEESLSYNVKLAFSKSMLNSELST